MQDTQMQVAELAPAVLELRPKRSNQYPGRAWVKYRDTGGIHRYWKLAEAHAGTGARRGALLVERWRTSGRSFTLQDPDAPGGTKVTHRLTLEEFEALLGGPLSRWDWTLVFTRLNARRAGRIAMVLNDTPDALNEVRVMAGLPPAPTLEEERQQMHDEARNRLPDLSEDARAYLYDPSWTVRPRGKYAFGMDRGDLLIFAPTERPKFPAGGEVSEVDADGLREMRPYLFDPDDDAAAVWPRLASRFTPLTHEWHPGYVDPLAEFMADHRHFRRKVSPVLIMSGDNFDQAEEEGHDA